MTVARVEQLIALAMSTTSDEEARTAAMAAVRLIRKLDLKFAVPTVARKPFVPVAAQPPPRPRSGVAQPPPRRGVAPDWGSLEHMMDEMRKAVARQYAAPSGRSGIAEEVERLRREGEERERKRAANRARTVPPDGGAFGSAFVDVRCHNCGSVIRAGHRYYAVKVDGLFQAWCEQH